MAAYPEDELPLLRLLPLSHRIISLTDFKKEFGLTKSQIILLIALHYRGSITMGQAAEYILSTKEQATRTVAGIVDQGLAERFILPENRTHVYLRLTEKGQTEMDAIRRESQRKMKERIDRSLNEEEKMQLRDAMNTFITLLNKVK